LKKVKRGFDCSEPAANVTDAYRAESAAVAQGKIGTEAMVWGTTRAPPPIVTANPLKRYCMRYFMGQCFDASHCSMAHPANEQEKREGYAKLMQIRSIPCKFGGRCSNQHCMYLHPGGDGITRASGTGPVTIDLPPRPGTG